MCIIFFFSSQTILWYFSNLVIQVIIAVFENHNCYWHITFEKLRLYLKLFQPKTLAQF